MGGAGNITHKPVLSQEMSFAHVILRHTHVWQTCQCIHTSQQAERRTSWVSHGQRQSSRTPAAAAAPYLHAMRAYVALPEEPCASFSLRLCSFPLHFRLPTFSHICLRTHTFSLAHLPYVRVPQSYVGERQAPEKNQVCGYIACTPHARCTFSLHAHAA